MRKKCLVAESRAIRLNNMNILKILSCFPLFIGIISARTGKPNIILLIVDDLGWNDVGFHGSNEIPTPNIDALAYNGMILNRHYTQPTCTPSRTALMTGKYPFKLGMQGAPIAEGSPNSLPLKEKLLPQYLKDLGYATNLVGKWHLGYYKKGCTPTMRGFDSHFGYYNGWIRYNDSVVFTKGGNVTGLDAWENHQHAGEKFLNKYSTDVFTDEAINVIKAHDTEKPLLLDLSYSAVHAIRDGSNGQLQVRDFQQNERQFGYIKDLDRRMFAGVLSAVDESVGKIIEALHEKSMLKNSVVLFISDNGGATEDSKDMFRNSASNWPLRGWKYSLTEGGVRGVAAMWSSFVSKKNSVSQKIVHLTDWLPTFYAAAGGNVSQLGHIDGINQWDYLTKSQVKSPRKEILLNIDEVKGEEAMIMGNWKLIKINTSPTDFGGSSGRDDKYNYNMTAVLTCKTHQILNAYSNEIEKDSKKTAQLFWKLRNRAKIDKHCRSRINDTNNENGSNAKCFKEGCLFRISDDHCEFKDLSQKRVEIVTKLRRKLNKHRKSLVKQLINNFDPNSDPKYFHNYWSPWVSDLFTKFE